MSKLAIIPVRLSSVRLPNKPLADINGKTMIERVWRQTKAALSFDKVIVATEDKLIAKAVETFGGEVVMTSNSPRTGSDRVAEALLKIDPKNEYKIVANVQGDMPFINPLVIDGTVEALVNSEESFGMSTVATSIISKSEYAKNSCVKVVTDFEGRALYFSRSPIPHIRDQNEFSDDHFGLRHLGLYVFRREILLKIPHFPSAPIEEREKLEQLRALYFGVKIKVHIAESSLLKNQIEVDTQEDLDKAIEIAKALRRNNMFKLRSD
jgi:3-deoxy-manno-octulosonate cytidylyltransferase (CMP-KDO synthetase)